MKQVQHLLHMLMIWFLLLRFTIEFWNVGMQDHMTKNVRGIL